MDRYICRSVSCFDVLSMTRYSPSMRILLGTSNPGKVQEVADALGGLAVELVTPNRLGLAVQPEETGNTYAENALIKARAFHVASGGLPTMAEDAGIIVAALKGELGIHTRRWGLGSAVSDAEWIAHFLARMCGVTDRSAAFHSAVAFINEDDAEHVFEGHCAGEITATLEAQFRPGLPFDGCFRPASFDRAYGALSLAEKNVISHRGAALRKFRTFFVERLSR